MLRNDGIENLVTSLKTQISSNLLWGFSGLPRPPPPRQHRKPACFLLHTPSAPPLDPHPPMLTRTQLLWASPSPAVLSCQVGGATKECSLRRIYWGCRGHRQGPGKRKSFKGPGFKKTLGIMDWTHIDILTSVPPKVIVFARTSVFIAAVLTAQIWWQRNVHQLMDVFYCLPRQETQEDVGSIPRSRISPGKKR